MYSSTSTTAKTYTPSASFLSNKSSAAIDPVTMRILYCNKYNFAFSGTEVYLFELMKMMSTHAHEVALFSMADPRGEPTPHDRHLVPLIDFKTKTGSVIARTAQAAHAIYSFQARRKLRAMIAEFKPDIAHVRNIYHHLSPSILWELKSRHVPVVYHLNDFKMLCPSYNMVSHGQACNKCQGGKFWHVINEGCYQSSLAARAVLAAEAYAHKWLRTYEMCIDCFIAPSQFVKQKLIENGWDATRIHVLPHFQTVPESFVAAAAHSPILYFGRLSPEKGVADLLRAMQKLPEIQLRIAGDGPQRAELERLKNELALHNVTFTGHLSGEVLNREIASSRFTVLPSRAYETLGKSILESYSFGRAVVASDLGSRRELVNEGKTGMLYESGNVIDLAEKLSSLTRQPELAATMGAAGRELVNKHFTPEDHYEQMLSIYEQTLVNKRPRTIAPSSNSGAFPTAPFQTAPLRVAFVGGRGVGAKYSGIETFYEEAGKQLQQRGHQITLYCRNRFTPKMKTFEGMRVVRLPTVSTKHLETPVHTFLSAIRASFSDADIVHFHALGPALFSFIPRIFGKKTVVTIQGLDWQRKKWGRFARVVLRLGEQASIKFCNQTMVVSETLRTHYETKHGTSPVLVPNGTRYRQRMHSSHLKTWGLEENNYILYLGRLSPEKNCDLLIKSYEQLHTEVKLVLAGGSNYADAYAAQLRTHASEKVIFLDWVFGEALDQLLTNAMLFVLPSDIEGLSLSLLDAMGAGVCVLTSDIPENIEAVKGVGYTFKKGDAAELQRMLQQLLLDPAARELAAYAAQSKIRAGYLWPEVARKVEAVYRSAMGHPSFKKPPQSETFKSAKAKVASSQTRRQA
jgi:glycosyltransferase involved in cell wall biosynthesis